MTEIEVRLGPLRLPGSLSLPDRTLRGIVVFAHGSGSGRYSPRNQYVAEQLHRRGLATLLFDLLNEDEAQDRSNVFDIALLAQRLGHALEWQQARSEIANLPTGLFGASTGAAAAIVAAARRAERVAAVVSRGGRPDLAGSALALMRAPTLLIVGGADPAVLELNKLAAESMTCKHELQVVRGASHLFEEPGALEAVGQLAAAWFARHLKERSHV